MNETFCHGVASGDPLQDRVVIWTRVSGHDGDVPVRWKLGADPELHDVLAEGEAPAGPGTDHTLKVDVPGLEPGRHYWYGFEVDGRSSAVGRTRTMPGPGCEQASLVMSSCAKFNAGFFNAYARMADRDDVNFWLHLGDYIYEASQKPPASQTPGADIGRPFEPQHECKTLADYRRRYAQYRSDPDVQRLHATHPLISTVDDHEFADGAWRGGATEHVPERDGPWEDRVATAFRVRSEWIPLREPDPEDPSRIFRSFRVGDLAELFLIDTRSRRDEPIDGPEMDDEGRTQLGAEQKKWLLDALRGSKARHRLIGNGSVMTQIWDGDVPEAARDAIKALKLANPELTGPDPDQWDGYPAERDEVLAAIEELPERNVVVLSGDVHIGMANELRRGPDAEPAAIELVTTSLTSQNVDDKLGWGPRSESVAAEDALREALPWMKFLDFDSHGYVKVDLTPDRVRGEWWFCDTVLERSSGERLGAAFEVPVGSRSLVPAAAG